MDTEKMANICGHFFLQKNTLVRWYYQLVWVILYTITLIQ